MYVLIAILILFLSFFNREGFDPYHQEMRLPYFPDQKKMPNIMYAEKCIQDIINSGVSKKQGEHLADLLNLLQFI
jgi:hypothetical protein